VAKYEIEDKSLENLIQRESKIAGNLTIKPKDTTSF